MRRSVLAGSGLGWLLFGLLALNACGGDGETDRPEEETGGSGGTGATTGGTATGGTATGGTATGGTATGGAGGAGGSGGSAGSGGCKACTVTACSTLQLPSTTINDFENLLVDPLTPTFGIYGANDAAGAPKPEWWTGYFSGSFAYPGIPDACTGMPNPMYPVTRTDVDGELSVTGTVGTYSGFGVWLGQCLVDMSMGTGVSFRIGGETGTGTLKFSVATSENQAPETPVECLAGKGGCDVATAGACTPASVVITVPATPEVITVTWAELTGGSPAMTADPTQIAQLQWDFDWAEMMTPYEVNVTVDDVVLLP